MLRGIVGQKEISKERLEAKKEQIQEQALKRFTENASKRNFIVGTVVIGTVLGIVGNYISDFIF